MIKKYLQAKEPRHCRGSFILLKEVVNNKNSVR